MQISQINRNLQSFGHSFRVSICVKDENGNDVFVNPASNHELYKKLNSKIVSAFNENLYSDLRNYFGLARKVSKPATSFVEECMVKDLKNIDTDYDQFNFVRSVYNKNHLAYIATGVDVPIIENLKGTKQIGIAKSDSFLYKGTPITDYVKSLSRIIQNNVRDYIQDSNILLRSKQNKEIILRTIFTPTKDKKGKTTYKLDNYEFHEIKSKPQLPPIKNEIYYYKYNESMRDEILRTIKHHAEKIVKRKIHYNELEHFMQQKREP